MNKHSVELPGYKEVDANFLAALLDAVHDIAQELAYINKADLKKLDSLNRSYVECAFSFATRRAQEQLSDIMLKIRNLRTPRDME